MSASFETSFARALLDTAQPIPSGITAHNAAIPTGRFAVYRNNVVVGLVNALRSRFPVVEKIVGEEFFAAMARVFVLERPPARRCSQPMATNSPPSSPRSTRHVNWFILPT
jgi:hypothetical protein